MTQQNSAAAKPHIALRVRNLRRSLEFYRKIFAAEPVKVRQGYAKFDLSDPPLNLALNEITTNVAVASGALSHLGIQVASSGEVLAMRERWRNAGLDTRDEMKTECCYARQDKTWACDPDGNEWEVFVVLEDNLPEKSSGASSCCQGSPLQTDFALKDTNAPCCAPECCAEA